MDFFATLEKNQRKTPFLRSSEMHYFLDNNIMLQAVPQFKHFIRASKPFDIIRANIILRALQNKEIIEKAVARATKAEYAEGEGMEDIIEPFLESLPYLRIGKERIFVPIFPRSVNRLYDGDFEKFYEKPYNALLKGGYVDAMAIDPFDAYGSAIYDSYFTKLVPIASNEKESVFLDYDSHSLFCINKDGRLNARIALFDKYIRRPYLNHMVERVAPVVAAYLADQKETMIDALVENGLISRKIVFRIFAEERKVFDKIYH